MQRDLKNHILPVTSVGPAARTTTVSGTGVDLADAGGASVEFVVGTITDGTHTPKIQESDDNSSWGDVAAADLDGTLAALASDTNQRVGYLGLKRYIRAVVTVTGGPATGGVYAAVVVKGRGRVFPVT